MNSADHYATLGLARDATAADIRAAYRRQASAAHPDKGGSVELMSTINLANDVLSDPERRARYDETGQDALPNSIQLDAEQMLMGLFAKALSTAEGGFLDVVTADLQAAHGSVIGQMRNARDKAKALTKRRDALKVKGEARNLAHMVIDQQVAQITQAIVQMERALQVVAAASKMVADYESTETAPVAMVFYQTGSGGNWTGSP